MERVGRLAVFVLAFSCPAGAQEYKPYQSPGIIIEPNYAAVPYYEMLVRQALAEKPDNFPFAMFRGYYAMTRQYDPVGEDTLRAMLALSQKAGNDPDPQKRREAFERYGELLAGHLANIEIVNTALALGLDDKRFGDPEFLQWMRAGLLQNILHSGDGSSLMKAYDAVTMGEEVALMQELRLRVLKTESAESGGVYYNMHQVKDRETGQERWIFVDVTRPLDFLERRKREKGTYAR